LSRREFGDKLKGMEIQYFGHSCFRIKGKDSILLTDPYSPQIGLKMSKTSADIVTVSHQHYDHNNISAVTGTTKRPNPFIISGPGEYEISGVFIYGLSSFHGGAKGAKRGENTIYVINMDGIRLAHLGDLGHPLRDEQLEELNGVDILMIPVGGTYTLDSHQAVEVINQIEPRMVIPMHYQLPGLKIDLAPVEEFLKEIGMEVRPIDKLITSIDKLPEERQVVVLNARS
jgi:L-ascorbate metabolism protein UlaG (beta-lactamase superfamily)